MNKKRISKIEIREWQRDLMSQMQGANMDSIIKLTDKINEIIDVLNEQNAEEVGE